MSYERALSSYWSKARSVAQPVVGFFAIPENKPELLKAQYRAFIQQMPMMYVMLMTSTWSVAAIYFNAAPLATVLIFPVVMTIASASRVWHWWRARDTQTTAEIALKAAKKTCVLAMVMASGFVVWTFILFPYGDAYGQSLLAFFLATVIVAAVLCLLHNKPAAFIVVAIASSGFIGIFGFTGVSALSAAAIDITVVSIVLLIMIQITHRDFSQMVEGQIENSRLANLDSLTEIPNRRAFFARLAAAVDAARLSKARLAVGIIDLDGFKPINDLYGHPFGDKLLIEVSRRLSTLCAAKDIYLARLGGDEFALIVPDVERDEAVLEIGEALCDSLHTPFVLADATVQIAGSVGFAIYSELAQSPEELFEHADYALYDGKRGERRGRATLFSVSHVETISRNAAIEQALKIANIDEEMSVVFQPIVDVGTGRATAFEALARWASPILGNVSPGQFIPAAERAGIVSRVTRPLLKKALAAARKWPPDIRLSFNLSAYDLSSPENVLTIISIIKNSGIDPSRIDLEITETAFGHDFEQVQTAVRMLKLLGCGISLDDFGTGYSSLSRLHALSLTKIKIDRSFVVDLHRNAASVKIVKSLLALSRDMGLDCVIEGVETQEEITALRKLDLSKMMVQGYFYSPPVTENKVRGLLEAPLAAVA